MLNIEDEQQVLRIGTQVEISSNEKGFKNCWYKCTIIDPRKSHNMQKRRKRKNYYWVEYQNIVEEEDQSKPLRESVEASFIRPLPPPASSACTKNFEIFDVVEANYREGWWIGVVIKVMNDGLQYLVAFVSPYEKIVFSRDKLRHHLTWLGGDQWILLPKKNDVHCPQDGNGTVRASQVESILAQVKSSAKRLRQTSSYMAAPPLQSCRLSMSEGNIAITDPQCAAPNARTVNNEKITHCVNSVFAGRHLSTTPCLNRSDPVRLLAENRKKRKLGNNKKIYGKSYGKLTRDCSPNKPIQRVLRFLQPGEELGESDAMHESAIEQSPTSEAVGSQCKSFTEVPVTEIVDEINDTKEVVDEQDGGQRVALYSNPGLIEHSKPHLATLRVNSQSDKTQSLPFTKRSRMWKVIESMEVFKRIPQMPHFSPLKEQGDNWREMFAISMMVKFAYEVERITTGSLHDPQNTSIINESLDNLKELELHGFRTILLQVYLKELLEKIGREKELQKKLDETVSGIRECQAKKTEAERKVSEVDVQIKSLQEQVKYSESVKYLKEQQLAKMESVKGRISSELHRLRLAKKRPPTCKEATPHGMVNV